MKRTHIVSVLLFAVFLIRGQQVYELKPSLSLNDSYALQHNGLIDCFTLIEQSNFNDGPWIPSFKVGFYLSADSDISPSDIRIGSVAIAYMPSPPWVVSSNGTEWVKTCSATNINLDALTVPTGTYFIGTYLDYENVIPEFSKTNNGAPFWGDYGLTKINYVNVGIPEHHLKKNIKKNLTPDNELVIKNTTGEDMSVELYTIEGRAVFNEKRSTVIIPKQLPGLYLLRISHLNEAYTEKIFFY